MPILMSKAVSDSVITGLRHVQGPDEEEEEQRSSSEQKLF